MIELASIDMPWGDLPGIDMLWLLLDLSLALLLLGLGAAAVGTRDLRRGVALFIAFGLLVALVWARLRAPDLALAEAVIGAGVSGALLLAALRDEAPPELQLARRQPSGLARWPLWLLNLGSLGLAFMLGWALLVALASSDGVRLADLAMINLEHSGVSNPVTAVLLNYRAYDTLLELGVVLAAVLGVLALGPARRRVRPAGPVLRGLIRLLLPLLIITAGYLLWIGATAPGGAFQAGATLAAAAVLLRLGGDAGAGLPGVFGQRWLLTLGIAAFVLVGLGVSADGGTFLAYPRDWAGALILVIEAAATLSIACALALAYLGGRPAGWDAADRGAP